MAPSSRCGRPAARPKLQQSPELRNVASDQQDEGLVTKVTVNREAAQRLGVSMQTIQDVLYDSFGQRQISTIFSQANQYRVILEARPGVAGGSELPAAAARARRACRPQGQTTTAGATVSGRHRTSSRSSAVARHQQSDGRPAGDHARAAVPRR